MVFGLLGYAVFGTCCDFAVVLLCCVVLVCLVWVLCWFVWVVLVCLGCLFV